MKFTPFTHPAIAIGFDKVPVEGHVFTLENYPTIQVFVGKPPGSKLFVTREVRTGLRMGAEGKRTRKAAVDELRRVLDEMANRPGNPNDYAFVCAQVEKCVEEVLKPAKKRK